MGFSSHLCHYDCIFLFLDSLMGIFVCAFTGFGRRYHIIHVRTSVHILIDAMLAPFQCPFASPQIPRFITLLLTGAREMLLLRCRLFTGSPPSSSITKETSRAPNPDARGKKTKD